MTAPNNSETKGTLQEHSFTDLLAEISQVGLSGSLRLTHLEEKAVVYFQDGAVVFAVSNLRQHRLFQILLNTQTISKEILGDIPNFTNDFELAEVLIAKGIFTRETSNIVFASQIEEIIKGILHWKTGLWDFSHLARAKENMRFQVDTVKILVEFVRNKSDEEISQHFRSLEEKFIIRVDYPANITLQPVEGYIFSRFDSVPVKLQDIKNHSGMPAPLTLKVLYLLWVGGFINRQNWQSAFSENKVKELLGAKLTLKAPVIKPEVKIQPTTNIEEDNIELDLDIEIKLDEDQLLEQYLKRVETAESYYEILEVSIKATVPEIKVAYFKLAKSYHPDKFHNDSDSKRQLRVQNAFTEIARSYETLKDEKARELYDFKLRKYLESIKEQEKLSVNSDGTTQKVEPDKAKMEFDQGFDYLLNQDYEKAIPFLARSVQLSPENARYHAYYGKSLSFAQNQRFKAESELNTAIKLDAENPSYRIMLVEFYMQFNLLKRAEGELQRLLTAFPGNKEAQVLLDSLSK
ncbi:MAG: DnaJ domain-containing protein [Acidobacteriota bacterium]